MGYMFSDEIITEPQKLIDYYEEKGFKFLADWNSSKLLMGKPEDEPYIPDRICTPSGRVLDESELIEELRGTKIEDPIRGELEDAFYYFNALTHEEMGTDRYNGACSFLGEAHEKETMEKYRMAS